MGATSDKATTGKPVHLSPDDTWGLILGGEEFRGMWSEIDREEWEALKHPGSREVFDWTLTIRVDAETEPVKLTHLDIIKAMRVMVAEREQRTTNDSIIDKIAAVLDAENHDAATDELVQLDAIGFDLIAQVAAVGKVVCP